MVYVHDLTASPGAATGQAAKVFKKGRPFSHMMADTLTELVTFATKQGLKKEWLQDAGTYRAHFDLTARRFNKIRKEPNVKVLTMREFAVLLQERRDKWKTSKPTTKTTGKPKKQQSQAPPPKKDFSKTSIGDLLRAKSVRPEDFKSLK